MKRAWYSETKRSEAYIELAGGVLAPANDLTRNNRIAGGAVRPVSAHVFRRHRERVHDLRTNGIKATKAGQARPLTVLDSPVIVALSGAGLPPTTALKPPGEERTVYSSTNEVSPGFHATLACVSRLRSRRSAEEARRMRRLEPPPAISDPPTPQSKYRSARRARQRGRRTA